MKDIPKPNFFIVGAPKAGTTALYSYLRQHPEIFMSRVKEPQFFANDICGDQRNITSLAEYLSQFKDARANAIGEASTCYLGSPGAVLQIQAFCETARIIIMLRNPIDVMYAEHSERLFDGTEHISCFATALDSKEDRKWRSGRFKGQRVLRLSYRELVLFSEQVKRFIDIFRWPNIHVIVYDEFVENPAKIFKKVSTFLEISSDHECAFNVVHANRRIRSVMIHDLLCHPPKIMRRLVRSFLPSSIRRTVGNQLDALNMEVTPRPVLDHRLRCRLSLEYAREVHQLGTLIGRDLFHWTAQ